MEFLARIRPKFKPPTQAQLSGQLLEKIHHEIEADVKKKIDEAKLLTIQCDSYTNVNSEGVMNFIINRPTPVYYKHVAVKDDSATGEYLAKEVAKVIDEIGLQKTVGLCTDNASYCKKAWRLIENQYKEEQIYGYGCASHMLNLFYREIVQEDSSKIIMADAVKIVKAIKDQIYCHQP